MRALSSRAFFMLLAVSLIFHAHPIEAVEVPTALADAKAKFYNFLLDIAKGQGISSSQRLVINSTIVPFDISADTPFYNEELFRQNADRTFTGAVGSIEGSTAVFQASRFAFQYRSVLNIAAAQIDQRHPEIANTLDELEAQLSAATSKLTAKNNEIEDAWAEVARRRNLDPTSHEFHANRITFYAQARYGDQIQVFSDNIDRLNAQIYAARGRVYTPSELAVLENVGHLASSYNIIRPWNAQAERGYRESGTPLTPILLADERSLPPAIFDSSPLVMPVGDLVKFLSSVGLRGFDTKTQSSRLDAGSSSWAGSGGGSFFGISLGGGGGGSSTFSRSVSKMTSYDISFKNISEYFVDRSAWFNPAVLQDPEVLKLVKDRRELRNLQYVSVSLILARGLRLRVHFSEAVNTNDWSQSSLGAQGGLSLFGFSFGGGGGGGNTRSTITVNETGTTVTFEDEDSMARVLGARVEPFVVPAEKAPLDFNAKLNEALALEFNQFLTGKKSYLELQRLKLQNLKKIQ